MATLALQYAVKTALRISVDDFADEIEGLIESAKARLRRGGVEASVVDAETDPVLKCAIIVYCKANFGLDNPDSEKYQAAFESMMVVLALSSDEEENVS